MTLHDVDRELPNGFHDALVRTLHLDFCSRQATLDLDVWVGRFGAGPANMYRPARLELRGFAYFTIEPPHPEYPYADPGEIDIDLAGPDSLVEGPPPRPGDFVASFFVSDWNSCINLSARDAELRWMGDAYDHDSKVHRIT